MDPDDDLSEAPFEPRELSARETTQVLIVDDDPDQIFTLSTILEADGYEVFSAETGTDALKVFDSEQSIGVALLDIKLPDMSGTELLRAIKLKSRNTACIMTTANQTADIVLVALNAGANRYFVKPIDPVAPLLKAIDDIAYQQRIIREHNKLLGRYRQLHETQKNTIRHLNRLQDLSRTVSSALDLDEVLRAVRNAVIDALGYDRCALFLVDPVSNRLQGRWGTDRRGEIIDISETSEALDGDLPLARVARGEIDYFLTDDWEGYEARNLGGRPHEDLKGVRARAILPLVVQDRVVGVLSVDNLLTNHPISTDDIQQILPFTYQAAIAIENARLFKNAKDRFEREVVRTAELRLLWQVAQAIASELSLEAVLDTLKNWVCRAMFTHYFTLMLFNRTHSEFEVRSCQGLDRDHPLHDLFSAGREPVASVATTGEDRMIGDIDDEPDAAVRQAMLTEGLRSLLASPLRLGDEVIGVIIVYSKQPNSFSEDNRLLLSTLTSMASAAIHNAQFYDRDKRIAETMQRELLTVPPKSIGGYEIGHYYQSALDEWRVGGDFYDVVVLPDGRAALLLADVSGKGLKAAVYTAMGKYMFRGLLVDDPSPGQLLGRLNTAMCRYTEPGLFITLFYGLLDPETGVLKYANAGHESPIHYLSAYDYMTTLDTTGVVLGVDPGAVYVEREARLKRGDVLLLYTDGITDARKGSEMLGVNGLQAILTGLLKEKPPSLVEAIFDEVSDYASGILHDDIAMLSVDAVGGPASDSSDHR